MLLAYAVSLDGAQIVLMGYGMHENFIETLSGSDQFFSGWRKLLNRPRFVTKSPQRLGKLLLFGDNSVCTAVELQFPPVLLC